MLEKITAFPIKIEPRASYFGDTAPGYYFHLNSSYFPNQNLNSYTQTKLINSEGDTDRSAFDAHANEEGLDSQVKVVALPVCIPRKLSWNAEREVNKLKDTGHLTELRGGRRTDLARPLTPETREIVLNECPNLVKIIQKVEASITGSDLFVRGIKMDKARASTTQVENDVKKANFHFDAEKSSLKDYPNPVFQYYANLSILPRVFEIIPVPLPEMFSVLKNMQLVSEPESMQPKEILEIFTNTFDVKHERIVIESGQLAIFNGRVFAHDAGKGMIKPLLKGEFRPSHEPDLILALDTVKTGYHVGNYDPEKSILEDPGTKEWWDMMAKFSKK
ncbi:MAG TPA: hypothetical protein VKC53_04010 [Patescibacteria group bacterium]|nr:hypothetical protein [Patescibacteria group bacterium]